MHFRRRSTPSIADLRCLRLQPGDKVVVTATKPITRSGVDRIRDQLSPHFPNHEVLVLDSGLDLSVVSASALPPTDPNDRPE